MQTYAYYGYILKFLKSVKSSERALLFFCQTLNEFFWSLHVQIYKSHMDNCVRMHSCFFLLNKALIYTGIRVVEEEKR